MPVALAGRARAAPGPFLRRAAADQGRGGGGRGATSPGLRGAGALSRRSSLRCRSRRSPRSPASSSTSASPAATAWSCRRPRTTWCSGSGAPRLWSPASASRRSSSWSTARRSSRGPSRRSAPRCACPIPHRAGGARRGVRRPGRAGGGRRGRPQPAAGRARGLHRRPPKRGASATPRRARAGRGRGARGPADRVGGVRVGGRQTGDHRDGAALAGGVRHAARGRRGLRHRGGDARRRPAGPRTCASSRTPEYFEQVDVNLVELYVTVIDRASQPGRRADGGRLRGPRGRAAAEDRASSSWSRTCRSPSAW